MDIFEELLEKTQGFPLDQQHDIRGMAETLQAVGSLARFDVVAETRYVMEHLPELREERVQLLRLDAKDPRAGLTKAEREQALLTADRLEKSTAKLALPDADEQFKRRAALVELSVRLKAQLRDVAHTTPEMDPEHLKRFKIALSTITKSMPDEMGSRADREMMARMAFVQELRDAGGHVDLAVDNFYKGAFEDAERGHFGDAALEGVVRAADNESPRNIVPGNQQMQDYVAKQILREDQAEHDAVMLQNGVLQAMPVLAAEHLSPGQYAAYRVMIDNEHLLDWKIDAQGKTHFQARTLDAKDDSNTVGKILQRELDYHTIRGATDLVKTTVDKLRSLALAHDGQEAVLTEKGAERIKKTTAEVLADPAAQAKNPYTKGKGKGGVEI
jgi:hypothetical protein